VVEDSPEVVTCDVQGDDVVPGCIGKHPAQDCILQNNETPTSWKLISTNPVAQQKQKTLLVRLLQI
jgi:hypothetical protein